MFVDPVFSIIIPTYNRADLLARSVKSVLQQTFSDFEIVVIDDASTDGTRDLIRSLDDVRLKYFRNGENAGAAFSRNRGIALARGKYISFLDSDDYYLPEFLRFSKDKMDASEPGVGFIWTGYKLQDSKGNLSGAIVWKPPLDNPYFQFLKHVRIGTGCGLTFRRECFRDIRFNEKLRSAEDTEFFLRLIRICRFDYIDLPLLIIHKHEGDRITNNWGDALDAYLEIYKIHREPINRSSELRLKYFDKIMTLAYRSGNVALGRKFFLKLFPQLLLQPKVIGKFIYLSIGAFFFGKNDGSI